MNNNFNLTRFHDAQERSYAFALTEIKAGYKRSHWMWYIFPQIKGLGQSPTSQYYGITSIEEAKAYLEDEILGTRLREICDALLQHTDKSPRDIFGRTDAMKLKSSMNLLEENKDSKCVCQCNKISSIFVL